MSNSLEKTNESKTLSSIVSIAQTTGINSVASSESNSSIGENIVEKSLVESLEKSDENIDFGDTLYYLGIASISTVLIICLYIIWIVGLCCLCKILEISKLQDTNFITKNLQ